MSPDTNKANSDSLMDYLPEPVYSKKEKKKLEKQKKKEEKERKLQEEKERQEKLLEEMKKSKKEKKEKPKKEKKEKTEILDQKLEPVKPEEIITSAPTLFQTLAKKSEMSEKDSVAAFMPFTPKKNDEPQEVSTLRIIPNVSDIEQKLTTFNPTKSVKVSTSKSSKTEIIVCKECGAILSSDYQFCNKCGSQL